MAVGFDESREQSRCRRLRCRFPYWLVDPLLRPPLPGAVWNHGTGGTTDFSPEGDCSHDGSDVFPASTLSPNRKLASLRELRPPCVGTGSNQSASRITGALPKS